MDKNNHGKYKALSLITNAIIVVLEIVGLILSLKRRGLSAFIFYTELSNYLTLIVSFTFCIYLIISIKNSKALPFGIYIFRFICTLQLTITLITVLVVLIPINPNSFLFLLFKDSNLFQHLLCPILSIMSFLFFEEHKKLHLKSILLSLTPTFTYGIVLIILNLLKVIKGPYPFFYLYSMPWYICCLFLLGVFIIVISICLLLNLLKNVIQRHNKKCH